MKIGIDRIGFATANKYLDLEDLAQARNVDPAKYKKIGRASCRERV